MNQPDGTSIFAAPPPRRELVGRDIMEGFDESMLLNSCVALIWHVFGVLSDRSGPDGNAISAASPLRREPVERDIMGGSDASMLLNSCVALIQHRFFQIEEDPRHLESLRLSCWISLRRNQACVSY